MKRIVMASLVAAMAVAFGCDDEPEAPEVAAPTTQAPAAVDAPAATPPATTAPSAADLDAAAGAAGTQANAMIDQARPLIEQAMTYIQENRYDLAEQALDRLEPMKPSLPESMQQQIEQAQTMLRAKRQGEQIEGGINEARGMLEGLRQQQGD